MMPGVAGRNASESGLFDRTGLKMVIKRVMTGTRLEILAPFGRLGGDA